MISFLKTHILPKLSEMPNVQFSAKSQELIEHLFLHMSQAAEEVKHMTVSKTGLSTPITNVPKSDMFSYMPADIRKIITTSKHISGIHYSFKIHHRKYNVYLFDVPSLPDDRVPAKTFDQAFHRIAIWLLMASRYSPHHCSRVMNIYIYWTDAKKKLPIKYGDPIDQIHANTAFTTSCSNQTDLNLFRREEWFKTFIHETFHNMGLDFSAEPQTHVVEYIRQLFPVKSKVNLFETYTETWAETIHLMFHIFFSTKNQTKIHFMIQKMQKYLKYERAFSLFQCAKVLHFFGMKYSDLYTKGLTANMIRAQNYKESTNVLAYYILKSLTMFHIDAFLSWSREHNTTTKQPTVKFGGRDIQESMRAFCLFFGNRYLDARYTNVLSVLDTWFHSHSIHSKHTHVMTEMLRTMRMTVLMDG